MSVYIQLTQDISGSVTAVTIGDWILGILKLKDLDEYEVFFKKFLEVYHRQKKESENARFDMFSLLLSASDFVFETLTEAKKNNKIQMMIDNKETIKNFNEFYKEVEEYFVILISILQLDFQSVEELNTATNNFIKTIKNYNVFPELRLKILQLLYNSFNVNFSFRFPTFIAILQFSSQNHLFHTILPYIRFVDEWIKQWNINTKEKRQIYLIIAQELKKINNLKDAFVHLKKHVYYFQRESIDVLNHPNTVKSCVDLIVDAINLQDNIYFHELIILDAVQNLQYIEEHRALFELLVIYYKDSIKEFLNFKNKYGEDFFKAYSLDLKVCEEKIYLLSIISLFQNTKTQNIEYIANQLTITPLKVEQIFVTAIGGGIIDAKIDQINKTVQMQNSIFRHFDDAQWLFLNDQIDKYIKNVQKIIEVADQTQI